MNEFWEAASDLPTSEKGAVFERLTQLYLQAEPVYQSKLRHVWLLRDVPAALRKQLNLPPLDEGIDLIACTKDGEYWAIQSKCRSESNKPLSRRDLSTFTSLAFNTCDNIAFALVAHTSSKPVSKRHLLRDTGEIGLERWEALDRDAWALIVATLTGKARKPKPRKPRSHQAQALSAAEEHFVRDRAARGRLIMPCGSGKSLAAYWIAQALKATSILVAVPSLALVRQSLADWTREFLAHGIEPDWYCVCSDESVGKLDADEFVGEVYELGVPGNTDAEKITSFLSKRTNRPKIVFTTYQSSAVFAGLARKAEARFDLAIFDEAHKTVGSRSKQFATLLSDKKINIGQRLFMTATERVVRGVNEEVLSMGNERDYGKKFFQLSFKQAIKDGIISDYKILTVTISDKRIERLIDENRILDLNARDLEDAEAQSLAAGIVLKRVYKKHGIKHAISFHRSIRSADRFREQQDALNRLRFLGPQVENFHISSKKTAGQRSRLMNEFVDAGRALMTNARCLTEGVDVPAIDCVMFADPKQSKVDIVQATGRALRKYPGKKCGYIVVPIIVPEDMGFDEFAETTAFRQVALTITALSTQDERIAEEFRVVETGYKSTGKIVEIDGDVPLGLKMKLSDFAEAIRTRTWESVGRANWRPFAEARSFVHDQKIRSNPAWRVYCTSGKKPPDIPSSPERVYAETGWVSCGDWLGTGTVATQDREYWPFEKARDYVRDKKFKSQSAWQAYCKSGKKPAGIPANPWQVYKDDGWTALGDWLGTGTVATRRRKYWSFEKARAHVRNENLTSVHKCWDYCKSGRKPSAIPTNPQNVYADAGWKSWGDWLGTFREADRTRTFRPYEKARDFARSLNRKTYSDWIAFTKSGQLPDDIPVCPWNTYKNKGWTSMGDWLGTGKTRKYLPFSKARAYARSLGLKGQKEWKSHKRPPDIPSHPHVIYAEEGWKSWGD